MYRYYALYTNGTITAVFSSMYQLNKWVKLLYKPKHKNDTNEIIYETIYLDDLIEDDMYSIYLLLTETKETINEQFFSTRTELIKTMELNISDKKNNKNNKITKMLGIQIIIDEHYSDGCLKDSVIIKCTI